MKNHITNYTDWCQAGIGPFCSIDGQVTSQSSKSVKGTDYTYLSVALIDGEATVRVDGIIPDDLVGEWGLFEGELVEVNGRRGLVCSGWRKVSVDEFQKQQKGCAELDTQDAQAVFRGDETDALLNELVSLYARCREAAEMMVRYGEQVQRVTSDLFRAMTR